MSDVSKSKAFRGFLWIISIGVIAAAVWLADAVIDGLPIWFLSQGRSHFTIECGVFWATVAGAVWRWLSRRVWIGSLPSNIGERT